MKRQLTGQELTERIKKYCAGHDILITDFMRDIGKEYVSYINWKSNRWTPTVEDQKAVLSYIYHPDKNGKAVYPNSKNKKKKQRHFLAEHGLASGATEKRTYKKRGPKSKDDIKALQRDLVLAIVRSNLADNVKEILITSVLTSYGTRI